MGAGEVPSVRNGLVSSETERLRGCVHALEPFFSRKRSRQRTLMAKGTPKGGGDFECHDDFVEREEGVTGDAVLYGEGLDLVTVALWRAPTIYSPGIYSLNMDLRG